MNSFYGKIRTVSEFSKMSHFAASWRVRGSKSTLGARWCACWLASERAILCAGGSQRANWQSILSSSVDSIHGGHGAQLCPKFWARKLGRLEATARNHHGRRRNASATRLIKVQAEQDRRDRIAHIDDMAGANDEPRQVQPLRAQVCGPQCTSRHRRDDRRDDDDKP